MKLYEFINAVTEKKSLHIFRVINIVWSTEPAVLFMQSFLEHLQTISQQRLVMCNLQAQSFAELQSQLAMSFLGDTCIYYMSCMAEVSKDLPELLPYIETYTGPHTVIISTTQDHALRERADIAHIFMEDVIDLITYRALYKLFCGGKSADARFSDELFRRAETIPLDTACVLMHYQLLIGKSSKQFFIHWFEQIVKPKQSLFTVSQHLFAQDAARFYGAWGTLQHEYPSEFWIAFWSEQLWQAIVFITIAQQDGMLVAKKSVTRLPFAFMNKDWKRHSLQHLQHQYDTLYRIDYANKNGALTDGLHLWCAKFFM